MRPAAVYIVAAAETRDGWPLVNADGAATSIAVHRTAPRVRTPGSTRSTGDSTPLDEAVRGSSDASTCVVRPYQPFDDRRLRRASPAQRISAPETYRRLNTKKRR